MEQNKKQKQEELTTESVIIKKRKLRRWEIVLCAIFLFVVCAVSFLFLGCKYTEKHWEYWTPDYEKIAIDELFSKAERTADDYETLYRQTGLTKLGIDGLLAEDKTDRILAIQEAFFADYEMWVKNFAPFTYIEKLHTYVPMAVLEDGDIIVSATTRVSWWRYGHAAIVVDGANNKTIEAISPGTISKYDTATAFGNLDNFIVLRPKLDKELRTAVATYVKEQLLEIPYRLTVGVFSKKYKEEITGTQCAHLVWYAYKKFGIDMDSTGGGVVKPQDIANSPYVEVVQAYGFDLDTLWT